MRAFSYQLYSSRNFGPLPDTLKMLAGLGYGQVEGYGGLYGSLEDIGALRDDLAANGLAMPTGHFSFDMVNRDPQRVVEIARALEMEAVIVPAIPPQERPRDAWGWAEFGRLLGLAGKCIQTEGIGFSWHNHAYELAEIDSAERPLDLIMEEANEISLELDLAWVRVGGEDPVSWVRKYADRLIGVHVKDLAPDGECADEDGWADVGHGVMDWQAIIPAVDASAARFLVMEHDYPSDDARFARRSIEAARAF